MKSHNASAASTLGAGLLAALVAVGCATPIKVSASVDPLAILGPGSLAYARLSGAAARELAPAALPAAAARELAPLLARSRLVALGIGKALPEAPEFQACLIGDFPFRAAALSFGTDPSWKREKAGYFNARYGLRAAVPAPGLALATTGGLEGLIAGAKAPGGSPIPEQLSGLAAAELALWVPKPFSSLAALLLGEPMELPVRGLLVSASPIAPGEYEATIAFLMEDADSARVFRPALKLAWYGIARFLLGEEAEGALGAAFALEGELYLARGVKLSGGQIAGAISRLGPRLNPPAKP
jgi:hypothetical protein